MQEGEISHAEKPASIQTPEHIDPMRKSDLRALLDLQKKGYFFPTKTVTGEDLTNRDIIEYGYTRQMAYFLDQAASKLRNFDFSGEQLEKLHQEITDVILDIDTMPDGVRFTPAQKQAVETGSKLLVDDLLYFYRNVINKGGNEYVNAHLGPRFANLPEGSYTIDTKTYPGVVVVRINTKEDYVKVAPVDTLGIYNQALGENELKGKVLVVRGKNPPDESTEYHEYLHFLNSRLRHLEPFPQKEKQAERAAALITEPFERKLDKLETEKELVNERKYSEMRMTGKASEATRQRLSELNQQIDKYEQGKVTAYYLTYADANTYSDPDIRKAFDKVRDELQAYSIGGNELPRRFVADTIGTGFADTLSKTTQGKLFFSELAALKEILTEASNTDIDPHDVGFLISGARNLQQAVKFIYLHMQQAPKRYTLKETEKSSNISNEPVPVAA